MTRNKNCAQCTEINQKVGLSRIGRKETALTASWILILPWQNYTALPSGHDQRLRADSMVTVASGPTSLSVLRQPRCHCRSSMTESSHLDCSLYLMTQEPVTDSLGNISLCGYRTFLHSRISSLAHDLYICEQQHNSWFMHDLLRIHVHALSSRPTSN